MALGFCGSQMITSSDGHRTLTAALSASFRSEEHLSAAKSKNADPPKRTGVSDVQGSFKVIPMNLRCQNVLNRRFVKTSIRQVVKRLKPRGADRSIRHTRICANPSLSNEVVYSRRLALTQICTAKVVHNHVPCVRTRD